jgi:hypothetical protein
VSDVLVEGALLVIGWWLARQSGFALRRGWIVFLLGAQLGFLASTYDNAEFLIGDREWIWRPSTSLMPRPHTLETLSCRPPDRH